MYSAMPKKYQVRSPVSQDYVKKQMTTGTCIPRAEGAR